MHFIIRCKTCDRVVTQCRCAGTKVTRYTDACALCKDKEKNDLSDRKSAESGSS